MDPCNADNSSWWISVESDAQESTLSRNLSNKMMNPSEHCQTSKQLGVYFQDQDSSSTQSTGQSYCEVVNIETKGYGKDTLLAGSCITNIKASENQSKSAISYQDHDLPHSPIHYRQLACFPLPYPDPYHCRFFSGHSPFPVVHSQMVGTRVPLPLDHPPHDEPIYVNAKQYKAILRRRQFRAKLEAQNKLSKARKPYLHESRHRHAINRARGSGGRFLNTKKSPESKLPSSSNANNDQDISDSMQLHLNTKSMVLTSSEITSSSIIDEASFSRPREYYRFSGGSLAAAGEMGMVSSTRQYLSVLQ